MALKGHCQGHLFITEGLLKLWDRENPRWNCEGEREREWVGERGGECVCPICPLMQEIPL